MSAAKGAAARVGRVAVRAAAEIELTPHARAARPGRGIAPRPAVRAARVAHARLLPAKLGRAASPADTVARPRTEVLGHGPGSEVSPLRHAHGGESDALADLLREAIEDALL
ncbi:MAG: hypothetical protein H5T86_11315 [Armatimonadetes bacterium]|nr:hypothetical protein [Armatimonadota bacterium]